METYLVNYEKLCYKNISSLTSILEIKSTELVSKNEKMIHNFDLWLSDLNLLMVENIKGNSPSIDLPSNYNCHIFNSPLVCKKENPINKGSFRIFRYEKNDDVFNASDIIIANFVNILNRDFLCFKEVNFSDNPSAIIKNEHSNMLFGFKSPGENKNTLISKDFEEKKFTENVTDNKQSLQNICFNAQNEDYDYKNKRKRDSEDLLNLFGVEFAPKQIKLENESLDYDSNYYQNNIQNAIAHSNQNKTELVDKMEIENENIHSKALNFIDNNHISNNSTNNTQFQHNSYINTGNNNQLNQSTNSNIIIEQPSKEQDLTLTPQNSNRFISFNAFNNNMTNDLNKERKPLHESFSTINRVIFASKPNTLDNKIQDNQTNLDNQIGKLNENIPDNKNNSNNLYKIKASIDNFTFNKNIKIDNKENYNSNLSNQHFDSKSRYDNLHQLTIVNCLTNPNVMENNKNPFFSNDNNLTNRMSLKSNYTFQNLEKKNADYFILPNPNNNNQDIYITKDSAEKQKLKKSSDCIKKLSLSKNYEEDNVHNNKEFNISTTNQKKFESLNSYDKNDIKSKEDDKLDLIHSEKIFKSETVNSNKNKHKSNNNKDKNGIINSESNVKNSKNDINNRNISNKENKFKGQFNNKENEINNQEEKVNVALKEQLNVSNFKDNLHSKNANNKINSINQNTIIKKENVLNSLINKNYASKQLEKTLEQLKLGNKDNIDFYHNKNDDYKKVSNFNADIHILATKHLTNQKETKLETIPGKIISKSKAGKILDIDLKIKKILDISSYDETQSNFTQSEKEKVVPALKSKKDDEPNKINNCEKEEVIIDYFNNDNNKVMILEENNNLHDNNSNQVNNQIEDVSNGNQINNKNDQLNKGENIQLNCEIPVKEESDFLVNDKCISFNFQQSREIEIGNNVLKNLCVYELTDETPNSSDYDESNDGMGDLVNTPYFNHKKKKVNPQWALDKDYVKQKILEQNNNKALYEEVFGKRLKIEYLDLRSIFSTDGSEFDLRGESADWKIDNTLSSRRYNRQSRFNKIDEDDNDNENNMFSNFKKTSRNLYNDFQP